MENTMSKWALILETSLNQKFLNIVFEMWLKLSYFIRYFPMEMLL